MFVHACEGELDERGRARLLSSISGPSEAAALRPLLGDDPEQLGVARLIEGRFDGPPAEHIQSPSSAVVFPIGDEVLAQVGRAYRLLWAPGHPLSDRQWAHAYLAKVHLHALQSLPQEQPLAPAYVWLAGRVMHHGRRALANVHRSPKRIAPFIAGLEAELTALHERLDASPHHGDPLLVAVERQRYRQGQAAPLRIADVERLVAQGFGDWAVERALLSQQPERWLTIVRDRAQARGVGLRGAERAEPAAGETSASDGSGTESGTDSGMHSAPDEAPADELPQGPSFPAASTIAARLGDAFDAAGDDESSRIALAEAAWALARRPDVADELVARRDALGLLARQFVGRRGAAPSQWLLEQLEDPEARRRIRFSQTRSDGE